MNEKLVHLSAEVQEKWALLLKDLEMYESLMVGFSGGTDSGLVCAAAFEALGPKMMAITIQSPVELPDQVAAARQVAREIGFPHRVIEWDDLKNPKFVENPADRCYHCKLGRFEGLKQMAKEMGYAWLADGSNADDRFDYRPGRRALEEVGVISPLAKAGLSKPEIRQISQALGLSNWNRPSAPCLATRFPYGVPVTLEGLKKIEQAEAFLTAEGYSSIRVRYYGTLAKIEVAPEQIKELVENRAQILVKFKDIGFTYITLDLAGYRSGSLNEDLVK